MNADGSGKRRLTRNPAIYPTWSPDGRKIAFYTGAAAAEIFVMNADGSGKRLLTRNGVASLRSGRPTGGRSPSRAATTDVYAMNADGSGRRNLARRPVDYGG